MKRNKSLLVFFISIIILVELSRGQNNRKTEVNVGVVTDVGTVLSDIEMRCINLSLADFYSSRPQFQTRLIPNIADSRNDVVGAAAAGTLCIYTHNQNICIFSYFLNDVHSIGFEYGWLKRGRSLFYLRNILTVFVFVFLSILTVFVSLLKFYIVTIRLSFFSSIDDKILFLTVTKDDVFLKETKNVFLLLHTYF